MPLIETTIQNQFEERRGVNGQVLIWITARNRSTGAPEDIGVWSGDDHQVFVVGGVSRTYYGAGEVIGVPLIRSIVGLNTVYHTITLPPFTDKMKQALQLYDARLAKFELHSVAFDIDTGTQLAAPVRLIKGVLQEAPENIGQKASRNASVKLKVASSARNLSLGVPLYKSDEAQRQVDPNDKGRQYVDVVGEWVVPWGES